MINNDNELTSIKNLVEWAVKIPVKEIEWCMQRVEYFTKELFKYSYFKVGDRVQLKNAPIITEKENHGWLPYKEVLRKGARATVVEIDHYNGMFRYTLDFGENKGLFCFYEYYLRRVR